MKVAICLNSDELIEACWVISNKAVYLKQISKSRLNKLKARYELDHRVVDLLRAGWKLTCSEELVGLSRDVATLEAGRRLVTSVQFDSKEAASVVIDEQGKLWGICACCGVFEPLMFYQGDPEEGDESHPNVAELILNKLAGSEQDLPEADADDCPDCGAQPYEYHSEGCSNELCPFSGEVADKCKCANHPLSFQARLRWMGASHKGITPNDPNESLE